jgi:hypothetical protein
VGEMMTLSAFQIEDEFEDDGGNDCEKEESRPAQLAAIRPGIS